MATRITKRTRPRGGASFLCQRIVRGGVECEHPTKVLDTRRAEWGVRRLRKCSKGHTFHTDEMMVTSS